MLSAISELLNLVFAIFKGKRDRQKDQIGKHIKSRKRWHENSHLLVHVSSAFRGVFLEVNKRKSSAFRQRIRMIASGTRNKMAMCR